MWDFAAGILPSWRKMQIPAMFVAPAHDVQATPKAVGELMADYGAKEKSYSTLPASDITRFGKRITCSCSARHWNGSPRARSTEFVREPCRVGYSDTPSTLRQFAIAQ